MKTNTEMAKTAFRYCGTFAALFILLTGNLSAQQSKIEEKPVVQVSYQQEESNYLVFKVTITNTGNKRTVLRVSDTNETLYAESFSTDAYIKTVKVPKSDVDQIEFRVSNGKEIVRKTFGVKLMTKETFEVIETEL
jgi:hypothetical protein